MEKIAIFYLIGQFGEKENWLRMYNDQINSLKESGLYDNAQFIELFAKGQEPIALDSISDKVNNITYYGDLEEDRPTNKKLYRAYIHIMQRMWAFASSNPEYKILFFHSLGVSRSPDPGIRKRTDDYRYFYEKILIHHWQDCVEILNHHDCAGLDYIELATFRMGDIVFPAPHYAGFFWWANADYISKLDPKYFYQDVDWQPYLCELWIGSGSPNAYCFHNTWKNRYFHDLPEVSYKDIIEKARNHINQLNGE